MPWCIAWVLVTMKQTPLLTSTDSKADDSHAQRGHTHFAVLWTIKVLQVCFHETVHASDYSCATINKATPGPAPLSPLVQNKYLLPNQDMGALQTSSNDIPKPAPNQLKPLERRMGKFNLKDILWVMGMLWTFHKRISLFEVLIHGLSYLIQQF